MTGLLLLYPFRFKKTFCKQILNFIQNWVIALVFDNFKEHI